MEIKKILDADYLDIVYENRNKNYGGYELRRNYDKRVRKGVAFLMLGVGCLACFSFVSSNTVVEHHRMHADTVKLVILQPKVDPPKPMPSLPVPPPPAPPKTLAYTVPTVQPDDFVRPDEELAENKAITKLQVGPSNSDGDTASISLDPAGPGIGKGPGVVEHPKQDKPYTYVQQMPQFDDLHTFLYKNLHYPEAASAGGIEGRVDIRFVVNEDGSVSDATVTRGIGGGCDQEALRVVNMMPKWKPGKQNGIAVKVYFNLPVDFVLAK